MFVEGLVKARLIVTLDYNRIVYDSLFLPSRLAGWPLASEFGQNRIQTAAMLFGFAMPVADVKCIRRVRREHFLLRK